MNYIASINAYENLSAPENTSGVMVTGESIAETNTQRLLMQSLLLLEPETPDPVIALMPEQDGIEDIGGTLRLGAYPCVLEKGSLAEALYGECEISERHRHRYEVNNAYREALQEKGMRLSGLSPDGRIVEMIELPEHPFFIATQAHPEFKSRPDKAHPLFKGFIAAAVERKERL